MICLALVVQKKIDIHGLEITDFDEKMSGI